MSMRRAALLLVVAACGDDTVTNGPNGPSGGPAGQTPVTPPVATCGASGGAATVTAPALKTTLVDDGAEGWLGSPAIADLDGDGRPEIIAVRGGRVLAWHADGTRVFAFDTGGDRIWASPVVGNFTGDAKLEVGIASRQQAWLLDATGKPLAGFPQTFGGSSETRTLGAGDIDGDGALDLVVGARDGRDIVKAYHADGRAIAGFPPSSSGASGCTDDTCFFAGLYDQNLAVGDLDGDGKQDLVLPMDNAYASFFQGTGAAFGANPMFEDRPKTPGVRYLLNLAMAKQGYADDEETENQAHFTNTPPAIADLNGDGRYEIVMVSSVQSASQEDRKRGVALWAVQSDASRYPGWDAPFHVPAYVMGLGDGFNPELEGDAVAGGENLVGLTNQVTVADIDPSPGLEMIFAGYDGKIHAVSADRRELWTMAYAEDGRALTPGLVVADLSADGAPEIVFATYSPDVGGGNLFVLSAQGRELHRIALPGRGAMAVPTVGDADGNGVLDVVVSLKDEGATKENVLVYEVPGSKPNCLLWPTGRANNLRNGWVR